MKGVRATFWAMLGNTRLPMQIDTGFSDVITPKPAAIVYPTILGYPAPELHAYNRETVIAEKFEAMVKLGELNVPDSFSSVIESLAGFLRPVALCAIKKQPLDSIWRPGGPWATVGFR